MGPLAYDPDDPAIVADPFPIFRRLQRERPVSWSEALRGWVVVGYADVQAALLDPRLSSARVAGLYARLPPAEQRRYERFHRLFAASIAFVDPPDQQRRKVAIKGAFDRGHAQGLAPAVARIAGELLAPARARGTLEGIGEFARPLASRVLAAALGVSAAHFAALYALADEALLFAGRSRAADRLERGRVALEGMAEVMAAAIEEIEASPASPGARAGAGDEGPGPCWIAGLLAAEARGAIDREEVIAIALNLTLAGEENVRHGIALGLLSLLGAPDALAQWRAEPAIRGPGLDELLRFDGPTQAIARLAAVDLEIHGQAIRAGHSVYLFLNAANRDEARFGAADRLDLGRADARGHLAFGAGIHKCIGQSLARVEIGGALGALVDDLGDLSFDAGSLAYSDSLTFRGVSRLPLTFAPRP